MSDLGAPRLLGAPVDDAASVASFGDAVEAPRAERRAAPSDLSRCRTILHVDPIGGAAGDMLIAALLDLGADEPAIVDAIAATGLDGFRVETGTRTRHAIVARGVEVHVDTPQPPRNYAAIAALLAKAPLAPRVRALAAHTFRCLAEAEAKVHRQPIEEVHFHEVGGVDAIVDIVGACAGLAAIEAASGGEGAFGITVGPIPLGAGRARGAHGSIPLPAPATLELLIGLPVVDAQFAEGVRGEMVTPTGAALLRAWCDLLPSATGRWPTFVPRAIGYGAGRRDLADRPNLVRLTLGDAQAAPPRATHATHVVVEANIDDMSGEVAAVAIEALIAAGALDAWAQPITMKKGRPALMVCALTVAADADRVSTVMLIHTTSLGVRRIEASRVERPRRFVDASTVYGVVRVKIADGDGLPIVVHPELDDCKRVATEAGVSVREVIRAAIVACP